MKNNLFLKISVAVTYLAMITVNSLANILPINNLNTGQVSDSYPNLFAPTGLTFSIWGLIYFLLAAYTLYQFGLFQKDKGQKNQPLFQKIGLYFSLSSVANIFWIFAWHYQIIALSLVLMLVILFCLIKIANLLRQQSFSAKETFFIKAPFSVYFGWITVATIANVTTFLVSQNWNGFYILPQTWTIIILLVGAAIGIIRTVYDRNIFYGLVPVWAYFGIWLKHTSPLEFNYQYHLIIKTVIICLVLLIATNIFVFFKKYLKK
jgi:hypothetical protein